MGASIGVSTHRAQQRKLRGWLERVSKTMGVETSGQFLETMRMHTLSHDALKELSALARPPCLSLFQPTHRSHPDNRQDLGQFKQGIQALEASLSPSHPTAKVQDLLAPFHALALDAEFWQRTLDGLAVLACEGVFRVWVLPRSMPMLAIVGERFHTQALHLFLQTTTPYQVLCLTRVDAHLFEGNRDALNEVKLHPAVPATAIQALGAELTEPQQTVSSHRGMGQGTSPQFHSTGGKKEEVDSDAERYFRALDRALTEHHAAPGGLPLILAALPEHQHQFRAVSHNPNLLPKGLPVQPMALDTAHLNQLAWALMELEHKAREQTWIDAFTAAKSQQMACDSLQDAAQAAALGRVASLLIESERLLPGLLDRATGQVSGADVSGSQANDMLGQLADLVQSKGGAVGVLAASSMPTQTGLAAVLRH